MSKELTPLQALEEIKDYVVNGHPLALETEEKGFPLIEAVLKNEDSEKFELIQQIRELKDDVASLESCNSKLWIEKEEYKKVLEIIKKKCHFFSLKSNEDGFCPKGHYRVYDSELYQFNELTKEQYDFLKEALKDE